jgi:hypothetical protein
MLRSGRIRASNPPLICSTGISWHLDALVLVVTIATARTVQGWPASGPGRVLPGPWYLAGGGAEAPTLKGES